MLTFPKAKLGDIAAITITSPDPEKSVQYYQQLGFSEVRRADFPVPWVQVSDGAVLIMLRKGEPPYFALTYYVKEMDSAVAALKEAGTEINEVSASHPKIQRYGITTSEGHHINLVTYVEGFQQPAGPTLLTMDPQDFSNPEKYPNKACGVFGELAYPVKDLQASIKFWEQLGFQSLSQRPAPYPWAILSDGLAIIGLHQTSDFAVPTITYFAPNMRARIEKLKAGGLTNFTNSGSGASSSNIVLTTPEQQKINLFSMGM